MTLDNGSDVCNIGHDLLLRIEKECQTKFEWKALKRHDAEMANGSTVPIVDKVRFPMFDVFQNEGGVLSLGGRWFYVLEGNGDILIGKDALKDWGIDVEGMFHSLNC